MAVIKSGNSTDQLTIDAVSKAARVTIYGSGGAEITPATDATLAQLALSQGSTTSGEKGTLVQGATTTAAPTYTNGQTNPLSLTTAGAVRTDSSATTQPVSGTVAATQSGTWTVQPGNTANTTAWKVDGSAVTQPVSGTVSITANSAVNVAQINGVTPLMGNGVTGTGSQRVTIASDNSAISTNASQSGTWNITNVSGTVSLPTGAATETTLAKLTQTQGSTTSGQSGPLMQGAVTTAAPSYTTAQTSPLSLTTAGAVREDINSLAGNTVLTGNGVTGTGSLRVTVASDNTAFTVIDTGNVASGATDSGNPVKIGGVASSLTTAPTAVTVGQRVNNWNDSYGRQITTLSPRGATVMQQTTITTSTSETTIVTAVASTFLDLAQLIITNSSATALSVTIKDSTAGTTRLIVDIAANGGAVIPFPVQLPQATVNNNWTATCSASVTSVHITAVCIKNI